MLATIYAPKAEITPWAKLVVKEVLKIIVIARVTRAVTHMAGIEPNNVLRKYAIYYPHLMIFAAQVYPMPAAIIHTVLPSLTLPC
jgi:hypothetical protein